MNSFKSVTIPSSAAERTEAFYGSENVIDTVLQFTQIVALTVKMYALLMLKIMQDRH